MRIDLGPVNRFWSSSDVVTGCTNNYLYLIKNKLNSFKNSERINEKGDETYRCFGYLSLLGDPVDWQHGAKENSCNFATFNRIQRLL